VHFLCLHNITFSLHCNSFTFTASYVSSLGGPPIPTSDLNVLEICVNGFNVSWDPFSSHPVCGNVKYKMTISPSIEITMEKINDTFYSVTTPTRLTNSVDLNVSVIGMNLGGDGKAAKTKVISPGILQAVPSSK